MARTKGEEAFIDQRTRQLLVGWADHCIRHDNGLPDYSDRTSEERQTLKMFPEYVAFAIEKGWLGKTVKDGRRQLTATGWNTAAAFLKR